MCYSKLQNASITGTELFYEGSLTVDINLLNQIGMLPYERVLVVNNNNGERLETYLIPGKPGSKEIILNGAAARKGHIGDRIIIMNYVWMDQEDAKTHVPKAILLDEHNDIVPLSS